MTTAGARYGSDVMVRALEHLGVTCATLNPGASFRGLHESLVHSAAIRPVLCLSELVAVAAAHGYAKAAGRPMAALLHNLVGLQSGSMGLFNAWIDQAPMLVLGGSGPADRAQRRPYIDWIHTARPQAAIVRDYVKWDDEPASLEAVPESLSLAYQLARTAPCGPTYVALDAHLQELELTGAEPPMVQLGEPPRVATPLPDLERLAAGLDAASRPLLLADYTGRSEAGYRALLRLAERTGARVVDLGGRHNFPNGHPADATADRLGALRGSDFVLALDVRDLAWALSETDVERRSFQSVVPAGTPIFSLGLNDLLHRGFLEREGLLSGVTYLTGDTETVLPQLAELVTGTPDAAGEPARPHTPAASPSDDRDAPVTLDALAAASWEAVREGPWQLAQGLLKGAVRRHWRLDDYNCHLGGSGGGGLGYGAGAAIGAALAHDGDDTLIVSLQPDGDFLYTASALWTAARESLPLLMIMANNRTYGQDRMHQETMSRVRGRPIEHAAVGIDIDDPAIDFAGLARSQGVEAFGPVSSTGALTETLRRAAATVRSERRPVLVDAVIQ